MTATLEKKKAETALPVKHKLREVWLDKAMAKVRTHFKHAGYDVPDNVRVGVGWPSKSALGVKSRRIGEAWSNACSKDETHEIIISLWIEDPVKVLGILIHEVIHVTVGVEHGHLKPFVDCMIAVGLEGKPTATGETAELVAKLKTWIDVLGAYPHAQLDGKNQKKQSTRLIKLACSDCGTIIRTSNKWIEYNGTEWPCPCEGILRVED